MNKRVLVTYASASGSTQEIAEVVAETLRLQGLSPELQPARAVRTLEGISGVVLGVSLYMFRWHRDALGFLSRHRRAFEGGLPLALFAGGPFGSGSEEEWQGVRAQVDQELAKRAWLRPVSVQIVGGKFDPAKLRFPYNLLPALRNLPANDLRDWAAIRAWAAELPGLLVPTEAPVLEAHP